MPWRRQKPDNSVGAIISYDDVMTFDEKALWDSAPDTMSDPQTIIANYREILEEESSNTGGIYLVSDFLALITGHPVVVLGLLLTTLLWILVNIPAVADAIFAMGLEKTHPIASFLLFDPVPFNVMGFILSVSSTILASVILLSSRRKEDLDRKKLNLDLKIAVRGELRYGFLNEKLEVVKGATQDVLASLERIEARLAQGAE